MQSTKTLALLGCGLMGGSFALAARQAGVIDQVIGYSLPQKDAAQFLQNGVIQHLALSPAQAVAKADVILLAVPVIAIPSLLEQIAHVLPKRALIMDVGSTKRSIQQAAKQHLGSLYAHFVGAHPVAGKEKAGHGEPFTHLYQDKTVVLCPDEHTDPEFVNKAQALWQAVGAHPKRMDANTHDRGLAAVSHLPHMLAFAYMDALLNQPDNQDLLDLGGPGFRDFSRIAGCDPLIWRDILSDNQDQVLALLHAFRQSIDQLESHMTQPNPTALEAMLIRASKARVHWN